MVPYRVIAEKAIAEWWLSTGGKSAHELATNESIEGLENGIEGEMYGVGGKDSIYSGIEGVVEHLSKIGIELPANAEKTLKEAVMEGRDSEDAEIYEIMGNALRQVPNFEELILDALTKTHDDWVERSSTEKVFNKKIDKEQLHQFSDLEVIGWGEASKDLLFLEPILNACGIEIDMDKLKEAYNQRVVRFCEERGIKAQDDLEAYVLSGKYEPLMRTEYGKKILETMQQNPEVKANFLKSIKEKGIGSISQFIEENKKFITPTDVEHATVGMGEKELGKQTGKMNDNLTGKEEQVIDNGNVEIADN